MTGREAIEMIAKSVTMPAGRLCAVQSVDTTDNTAIVNPIDDLDQEITVRIQADKQNGFFIKPSVGSIVGIIMDSDHTGEIVCFSKADFIQMLDGSLGGLVKIADLTTKLNNIENKVNAIITWGATVSPPLSTSPLTATNRSDIENTNITHGNP